MNTTVPRMTLRALSAPVFVLGLEWIVSGTNKIIGNFVAAFPPYVTALQASHTFLPGLSLMVRFPVAFAWIAILTETGLGVALILASYFFLRGGNRFWEEVGGTALALSSIVALGLWLIVGRPAFWPTGNGFGSGWPIEFFLVTMSAALAVAIAVADPEATVYMRVKRYLRRAWDHKETRRGLLD